MRTVSFLRMLLLPVSWLYGFVTAVRNFCFDKGILSSQKFDVPTICVGNLTVGGTGKTPHVEYLVELLHEICEVAVVSRGYRRKTKGLVIAGPRTSADEIGDEPFQIKKRFPFVHMAVDANRCEAINALCSSAATPPVGAIVLDDAFQHRHVAAGLNILLIDYHRPINKDHLLPAGMLRESRRGVVRADIVVVTKCPGGMTREESGTFTAACLSSGSMCRKGKNAGHAGSSASVFRPSGGVFFSTMSYGAPYKVFGGEETTLAAIAARHPEVAVLAAIARPEPFLEEVGRYCRIVSEMIFRDHHSFSSADLARMEKTVTEGGGRPVITTEKDAARLISHAAALRPALRDSIYALPIKVEFLFNGQKAFNEKIIGYVRQNQGDR